ncbi:putative AAA+ superfamily ATPase [Catenuloplanes nepalensis]|uniref:AAA+ superfamily ATPase n=1 Tax=Catenuloplanes nepalensis TaxID=587533 RepID=A0ABT9N871_9ACTN|nr:ATP-binding protein [Catenuloplanes nepalensis]MDP9799900.1 putative AAA+ superfamily ATPase [Catenuloplanes nepalensis]
MTGPLTGIAERRVSALLDDLVRIEPVIALHGPRSVGKSTVLSVLADARGVPVLDLDELGTRDAVTANPQTAVATQGLLCVDEYQHAPQILDALKARLNREGSLPGTAVLTGSTRQDALPRTAQALTGRLHTMTIWPLSQGEIYGVNEDFLPALRADPETTVAARPSSTTARTEYVDRLCAGGFPLALRRVGAARDRWFDNYIRQSLKRDAIELVRIRQRNMLRELLGRLAGRTGQILNLANVSQGLTGERRTIEDYVRLLEDLFLIDRLPAWGKTLRSRSAASPKVHVIDTGVAARLMRITPAKLAGLDPTALVEFGHLLETFVVGELRKQTSWLDEEVSTGHWRTHDGDEVDYVIEFNDGRVLAFEVKANERVSGADLKGLRTLRETLGDRFIAGVALSTGLRSFTYEDRIHIMPVDRLWTSIG